MIRHANNNPYSGSLNLFEILFTNHYIKKNKHQENINLILYLQDSASSKLLAEAVV